MLSIVTVYIIVFYLFTGSFFHSIILEIYAINIQKEMVYFKILIKKMEHYITFKIRYFIQIILYCLLQKLISFVEC